MENFLKDFYDSGIYPAEKIVPTDPDYRPSCSRTEEIRESLMKKLNAEDGQRLENLHNLYNRTCDMVCYAAFSYGLRLGVRFVMAALSEEKS